MAQWLCSLFQGRKQAKPEPHQVKPMNKCLKNRVPTALFLHHRMTFNLSTEPGLTWTCHSLSWDSQVLGPWACVTVSNFCSFMKTLHCEILVHCLESKEVNAHASVYFGPTLIIGLSVCHCHEIQRAKGDAHFPLWVPNLAHLTWDFGLKPAFQGELGTTGEFQHPGREKLQSLKQDCWVTSPTRPPLRAVPSLSDSLAHCYDSHPRAFCWHWVGTGARGGQRGLDMR